MTLRKDQPLPAPHGMSEHVAEANRPSAGPRASGTPFPVFGFNGHGIIETWNEAMADLTKIPTEIVIHSSLPSLRSALPSFQFQADPELQGEPADVTIIDTAGRQHTLKCEFDVRRDQQSRLISVLVTGIAAPQPAPSSSEPSHDPEQVHRPLDSAAASRLSSNIVHSLNNLLTVINGNLSLIGMSAIIEADPKLQPLLRDTQRAAALQVNLISALQQIVRLGREEARSCAPQEVLQSAEPSLAKEIPDRITLRVLPAPTTRLAMGSEALLSALKQLVKNAVEAIPGKGTIEISCRPSVSAPRHSEVTVRGSGCGIDPQFQRGLWEPSFTTKPAVQRAGLGLTIVDMLVNSVGGQLKITSTPGADANFSMILPNEQAGISQRAPHPIAKHQPRPRQV